MKPEKLPLHLETKHRDAIGKQTEFFLQRLNETIASRSVMEFSVNGALRQHKHLSKFLSWLQNQ
jgi:hypothetical protein